MPSEIQLLQQQKTSDLKRVYATCVAPFIKGSKTRAIVYYVFERVLLMRRGGMEIDGVRWFHDRQKAIAEAIGEPLRTFERAWSKLKQTDLVTSALRWRTEKGTPRRVSHWTLGQQVIDLLLVGFGLKVYGPAEPADVAVASAADVAVASTADVAEPETAIPAVPNKETPSPSTDSGSPLRVAAPASQAPPEQAAEQPKTGKTERPKPTAARRTRDEVIRPRALAEEQHKENLKKQSYLAAIEATKTRWGLGQPCGSAA